jgi:hypothetical protein
MSGINFDVEAKLHRERAIAALNRVRDAKPATDAGMSLSQITDSLVAIGHGIVAIQYTASSVVKSIRGR